VFEQLMASRPDRTSVVERELARWLDDVRVEPALPWIQLVAPESLAHWVGGSAVAVEVDVVLIRHRVVARERVFAERAARVDARVSAGAAHLELAQLAHGELARAAAERARAVAGSPGAGRRRGTGLMTRWVRPRRRPGRAGRRC
jgi:hypothetical protein